MTKTPNKRANKTAPEPPPARWPKTYSGRPALTAPSFASLADGYQKLWDRMTIQPVRRQFVINAANRIAEQAAAYRNVNKAVPNVPWAMVGMFDMMEGGGGANTHLHNGDPLARYTVHVPAGRPKIGHGPPFKFVESAVDALDYEGFDEIEKWDIPRVCYVAETMNGFGYRAHGINSPYLWSFTNLYTSGKYVRDGVYDSTAVSQQAGVMPILKMLFDMMPDSNFLAKPPQPPAPPPSPKPIPSSDAPSMWDILKKMFGIP